MQPLSNLGTVVYQAVVRLRLRRTVCDAHLLTLLQPYVAAFNGKPYSGTMVRLETVPYLNCTDEQLTGWPGRFWTTSGAKRHFWQEKP